MANDLSRSIQVASQRFWCRSKATTESGWSVPKSSGIELYWGHSWAHFDLKISTRFPPNYFSSGKSNSWYQALSRTLGRLPYRPRRPVWSPAVSSWVPVRTSGGQSALLSPQGLNFTTWMLRSEFKASPDTSQQLRLKEKNMKCGANYSVWVSNVPLNALPRTDRQVGMSVFKDREHDYEKEKKNDKKMSFGVPNAAFGSETQSQKMRFRYEP